MDPGSGYLLMHDEVALMTTNSQYHVHQNNATRNIYYTPDAYLI